MRVCLVTGEYPPLRGGVADHTRLLALALRQAGDDVSVLTSVRAGPLAARDADVDVHSDVADWRLWALPFLARKVRRLKPEVVHIQYQTAAFGMGAAINLLPWWLARTAEKYAIVTTLHDLLVPYLFPKAGPVRRWVTERLVRDSRAVIVTHGQARREVAAILEGGEGVCRQVALIPLGPHLEPTPVKDEEVALLRRQLGSDGQTPLIVFFGMINRSKGLETLLEAALALRRQGRRLRLVLAGEPVGASDPTNIEYQGELVRRTRDMGLSEDVHTTGFLEPHEVSAHLAAADVCVLPFTDGASFRRSSLLVALGHGVALVTTTPNPSEQALGDLVVRDGEHALLAPPGDAAALAQAVARLLDDPELGGRLRRGAVTLAARFQWPEVAARTRDVYLVALGREADELV